MFPAVPADEVEKPPVRPPQRPPARRKRKTLVLLRYTIGKQMLAYFLPSVILSSYTNAKRQFCLGSITKCHVTRYGGGLQSRAKNKAPFEKTPSCGFFHNGAMGLGVSFYLCLGWSANSQDGLQGWMEYATPALQVVIVPYQLGEHKRVRNRMNSSSGSRCGILGDCPC